MIKVISMQRYAEICNEADQLANKCTGCRRQAKAKAASVIQKLKNEPGKMVEDYNAIGATIIYTYTENLGTKRFPDCYREITNMEPLRHTEKNVLRKIQTDKQRQCFVLIKGGLIHENRI